MTKLEFTMIRSTTPDDTTALIALAEATGLFPPSALELLRQMLTDSLGGNSDTEAFWITDDDNGPVGVAYCEPERMTDRTWNLQLIAIHPDRQGQGRGTKLLSYVEQALRHAGGACCWWKRLGCRNSIARGRSTPSAATRRRHAFATSTQRAMIRSCSAKC